MVGVLVLGGVVGCVVGVLVLGGTLGCVVGVLVRVADGGVVAVLVRVGVLGGVVAEGVTEPHGTSETVLTSLALTGIPGVVSPPAATILLPSSAA